jgi:hypothetical protein
MGMDEEDLLAEDLITIIGRGEEGTDPPGLEALHLDNGA